MTRKAQPDEIWEAATAEFYPDGVATSMRTEVNGLVRDLRDDLGATPAEFARRTLLHLAACRKFQWSYTLRGLVRHWSQYRRAPKPRTEHETPEIEMEMWKDEHGRYWGRNKPT